MLAVPARLVSLALCAVLLGPPVVAQEAPAGQEAGDEEAAEEPRLSDGTFAGLKMRSIGPALMAGRIADIAIHPDDQSTWYVAVGSGNLWKTTNAGTTWETIFDDQGFLLTRLCHASTPAHHDTIWLGHGRERRRKRHVGYGDGVYRSLDGGKPAGSTWGCRPPSTSARSSSTRATRRRGLRRRPGPAVVGGRRARPLQVDRRRATWEKRSSASGRVHRRATTSSWTRSDPDVLYASTAPAFPQRCGTGQRRPRARASTSPPTGARPGSS